MIEAAILSLSCLSSSQALRVSSSSSLSQTEAGPGLGPVEGSLPVSWPLIGQL